MARRQWMVTAKTELGHTMRPREREEPGMGRQHEAPLRRGAVGNLVKIEYGPGHSRSLLARLGLFKRDSFRLRDKKDGDIALVRRIGGTTRVEYLRDVYQRHDGTAQAVRRMKCGKEPRGEVPEPHFKVGAKETGAGIQFWFWYPGPDAEGEASLVKVEILRK